MFVDECHVTRVNQGPLPTTTEEEKRDPGNEVDLVNTKVRYQELVGLRKSLAVHLEHNR